MRYISLEQLEVYATIGVYPYEQHIKQPLIVDLVIAYDFQHAGSSDDIVHTLDYAMLANQLSMELASKHFKLIERVAEYIKHWLYSCYDISECFIRVAKPTALQNCQRVSVTIDALNHTSPTMILPSMPYSTTDLSLFKD